MTLASGTRIGGYEITRLLGSGGMGEVYRAHDSRLNRDVAIKVLLSSVANDADRLARFAREAQVLASLNHPNIAHIHGLEPADPEASPGGVRALVMELVEGPTLADRLTKGALPVDEALAIATQIAEALEAAHDHGVIHRDLKPANIKVREDGTVKVLDFGLAKAIASGVGSSESGGGSALANSPTITTPAMTQAGVILGTASYMSPEQAKGRAVDKRSDVWAFGAVLYEMLTGTRPFDGEDITDVLGAVVRLEPDWSRLPADATAAVRSLVQGCLIKDRRHRVGDMAAALFVLKTSTTLPAPQGQPSSMGTQQVLRIAVTSALGGAAAAGLVAALLVEAGSVGTREAPAEAVVRFTIEPPNDGAVIAAPPAISPDGRRIVIHGSDRSLWLRSLDQVSVQRLSETAGGTQPFWSPDSRSVGFFADGKLKKIDVVGGLPVTLCDVGPNPGGGSWGPQGVILFAPDALSSPIHRVSAEGGVPAPVIRRDSAPGELGHALPYFLPDGRHFFYRQILGDAFIDRTRIGSLEEPVDAEVGLPGDSNALYANGALLFVRGTTLLQQPFDAAKLATSGHPTPIAENVVLGIGNTGSFDVSRTGTLIYFAAPQRRLQIAWVDRQARLTPLPLPPGRYGDPALSPDGRQIALAVTDETGQNIWVYDLERGTFGKRTFEGDNELPLWSRDGEHLVFSTAVRRGPLMIVRADGSGPPEPLITSEQRFGLKVATSWSADGGLMVFQSDQDIFVRGNDGSLQPAVATPASEREGRFAPTGPWLAYSSNETGRREVYVQSFPTGRGKRMISTDGGAQPMWAPGGGELFYKSGNRMMVVSVKAGATFEPLGTPRVLFEMPMPDRTVGDAARFVVSPDAKRFLVLTPAPGDAPSRPSLNVILNWPALVKATAP